MMRRHEMENRPAIDAATSRAVRDGISEGLRDRFTREREVGYPQRLRDLMRQLEREDA